MTRADNRTAELVELGDLDELTRHVDRLCDSGDWDGLVELRDRSRAALERGKQLWPAASLAEYRLALDAPGPWAAAVVAPGSGHFALGPLAEVAASTHTWTELAPHLPAGPLAAICAHERVIRGEDLTGDARVDPSVLELSLRLEPWEPSYPLASYLPDGAEFPSPAPPRRPERSLRVAAGPSMDDPEACRALLDLVAAWTTESNGRAEAIAVEGGADGAVAALGPSAGLDPHNPLLAELGTADALAVMAWAGASGGVHGRRRGMAAGRFGAWWTVAALGHLLDRWPVPGHELGEVAEALRWFAWRPGEHETGWAIHLAVEDRSTGRAWALTATDSSSP